jgi:hypothetical protein
MCNDNHSRAEQTECQKSPLTVVISIVDPTDDRARKHRAAIRKIQSVLTKIAASLTLVPLKYQHPGIAHCSYTL